MKPTAATSTAGACRDIVSPDEQAQRWDSQDQELALLARALGHPARVRILRLLLELGEETCVCGDICDALPLAQSTVSQHLKTLRKAGLITGEIDGPRVCYTVDRDRLHRAKQLMAGL